MLARGLAGSGPARTPGEEMRIGRQKILAKSLCCRVCASSLTILMSAGYPAILLEVAYETSEHVPTGVFWEKTRQGVRSLFADRLFIHRVRALGSIL